MDYILVHGLIVNPRLQHFQDLFDISQYAFVVQCSNSLATSLLHLNPALIRPEYQEVEPLKDLENEDESDQENEDNSDRETPAADCSPTAWLFPQWTSQRPLYTFGTSSRCNIILPRETNVSRKHFSRWWPVGIQGWTGLKPWRAKQHSNGRLQVQYSHYTTCSLTP